MLYLKLLYPILFLLGCQPLLGCCYLKAELMLLTLTFRSVLSLLGSQPFSGLLLSEGRINALNFNFY